MNSQNNADDSMNFSVIEPNAQPQAAADFSVRSLLGEQQQPQFVKPSSAALNLHKSVEDVLSKLRNIKTPQGRNIIRSQSKNVSGDGNQFLRDLSRMQKQLSFESELYNVYEDNANTSGDVVQTNKSKTISCLKLTKEQTNKSINKSNSKEEVLYINDYYGPLIIDFKKDKDDHKRKKVKSKDVLGKSSNMDNYSYQSSEYSHPRVKNVHKNKKNMSKDKFQSLLSREKSSGRRNQLGVGDFRKSKSRSQKDQLRGISKSQSNLKVSHSQAQNFSSSKVFTQYYGTQINVQNTKKVQQKPMKKQPQLTKIKSRQKSSSSRNKLGLVSPRGKVGTKPMKKKVV